LSGIACSIGVKCHNALHIAELNIIVMRFIVISLVFAVMTVVLPSCRFFNLTSEPDWNDLTSFKMYAFDYVKPLNDLKDNEMDTLVSIDIPIDEVRKLLTQGAKPTYDFLMYKTMILCRLKFKNAPDRRLVISSYGGFFTDLYADRLYKITPEYEEEWGRFVSVYERQLLDKNYMKQYPNADTTDRYRGD